MLDDLLDESDDSIRLLQLLHLADSALPIGGQAHSFGLETLTEMSLVTPLNIEAALMDYLRETGQVDVVFCRGAYHVARAGAEETFIEVWREINCTLAALRAARESREASTALARRFLSLAQDLTGHPYLSLALEATQRGRIPVQHAVAVGLVGGTLSLGEDAVALAYLQQSVTALATAAQRLLPVGQYQVAAILWRLKPHIVKLVEASRKFHWRRGGFTSFAPLLEIASMRHPYLPVRLFIS